MGECCVCGKETVQRCGSCGAAGFNLFFCSRGHQRLVWPAHKQVCGPNSNPFCAPDLSRTEASLLCDVAHVPLGPPGAIEPAQRPGQFIVGIKKSAAEYVETAFHLGPGGFKSLGIDGLTTLSNRPVPGSPSRRLINSYMRALLHRAVLEAEVFDVAEDILSSTSYACAIHNLLAENETQITPDVLQCTLHRAVILEWLTRLRGRARPQAFDDTALGNTNLARCLDCLVQPVLPLCRFGSHAEWMAAATLFAAPFETVGVDAVVITSAYNFVNGRVERYSVEPI